MSLWDSIKAAASGNFRDAGNYLFVDQSEIERGKKLDTALDNLNQKALADGKIDANEYYRRLTELQIGAAGNYFNNPDLSPVEGFKEGLKEGVDNVQGAIKTTLAAPIRFTIGSIPWQLWVLAIIGAALYLGWISGKLRPKI